MAISVAHSLVGFNPDGRPKNDFYPTSPEVTYAILKKETFSKRLSEPACGDGAISKVLEKNGHDVLSTDIEPRGYGQQKNFFSYTEEYLDGRQIVTNPPYKFATQWISFAMKDLKVSKMALFLKLQAAEGQKRSLIMEEYCTKIYQFSYRVTLRRNGEDPDIDNGGMMAFAWFIFEQGKPNKDILLRYIHKESNIPTLF